MEYRTAARMLESYGIGSVESTYVNSANDAVKFAKGGRIVLKAISNKALHKSKAGLVKLGLSGDGEIRRAFGELVSKAKRFKPYKILAQRMANGGIEIIVGGRQDDQFGGLILLGLGGIYVETFRDFALRVCPITRFDAEEMIEQMRSKNIITHNGRATKILVNLLLKASKLISENNLSELDLNPVILRENGYDVVDIRILK
jgi:succinyl-CoA synthetase beta subunit